MNSSTETSKEPVLMFLRDTNGDVIGIVETFVETKCNCERDTESLTSTSAHIGITRDYSSIHSINSMFSVTMGSIL